MLHRIRHLSLILPLVVSIRVAAQGSSAAQPPAEQLQTAAALFTKSDWKGSLDAYTALATSYPAHPLSRFRIGVSLMELHRLTEAEANLREGERLGIPAAQAAFRLAQLFAEQRRADAAIAELQRSIGGGLPLAPAALASDPHLASLQSHPKWPSVIDGLDAIARPCMHDPRFREFDFWIGDWDVRTTGAPAVGPAARNTVTLAYNGCVVIEHWKAPAGSEGESYNLFDRSVGQWRQTWVDNSGGQHDYRGGLVNGNMAYTGDVPAPGGQLGRIPIKLTFFKIGTDSVRQYSEISRDSAKTWQLNYDLMYVRRKAP